MSENTQLNANYMRCNKEELDKLEEFDKSEYDLLSEFTDITGYDVTCVINRLGVAVLPKLKEINLLDEFSKLQVESLIKKLGINILPNLKEVGLLDRFNKNDVYRLIKELGQDVLPYLQEVELLKKLDKYKAIELIKELGINILPNLKEVGLLDEFEEYDVYSLIKELGQDVLPYLQEVELLKKLDKYKAIELIKELGINILPNIRKAGLLDRFEEYDMMIPELIKELAKELGWNILIDLKKVGLLDKLDQFQVADLIKELGLAVIPYFAEAKLLERLETFKIQDIIEKLGLDALVEFKKLHLLNKLDKFDVIDLVKKQGVAVLQYFEGVKLLTEFESRVESREDRDLFSDFTDGVSAFADCSGVIELIKEFGVSILSNLIKTDLLDIDRFDGYEVSELIKKLGINILSNLKEVGLLDRLDGYEVSGLIKELGINILSNLKEVGLLDKMGSNNVERIIEDYNFDKDVLLKLNEFDLLYNVDINLRSFVKELKAGLAINPDIYNTNNIHKVLYAEYDLSTLKFLISKAIKEKDYETLKSITESHNYNEFIGLNYIKEYLDLNAIKVILNNTKFAHPLFKNIVIKNLKLDLGYYKDFCDTSAKEKLKDILYYIYEWQISNKAKLNAGHTNTLIEEVSYLSAFEFYQTHLEDFRFGKEGVKKLSFMFDEIRINPKLFIESIDKKVCLNDELGPLLSRTYSKELSIDNVKRIYQDIYASSKIGEVIIRYINQNIIRGDDIVINFTDKEKFSNFDPSGNKVTISLLQPFITIEAITVHEIGHYVIQSVFNSLIPGDICKYFNNEESKLEYVGDWKYIKSKDNGHYLGRYKEQLCFNPRISMFIKAYSDATKVILFKAVDILKLGMIAEDYKDYIARDLAVDLSKSSAMLSLLALDDSIYLEESQKMDKLNDENLHSIILNMLKYPELEKDLITDIKLIVLSNKLYQHMQEQNKLLSNIRGNDKLVENPKLQEEIDHVAFQTSQFSEIFTNMTNSQSISKQLQDLLFNRYLPALKSKLDLSEGESYFINRMVDLIGRTEEGAIYFEGEAVVRCIELEVESKFKGISEDIMKACDKMNQFWEEFILPEMDLN